MLPLASAREWTVAWSYFLYVVTTKVPCSSFTLWFCSGEAIPVIVPVAYVMKSFHSGFVTLNRPSPCDFPNTALTRSLIPIGS